MAVASRLLPLKLVIPWRALSSEPRDGSLPALANAWAKSSAETHPYRV